MRSESEKRPVLTSPWKIGVLVALLMVIVSCGASYYMIYTYDIKLSWLMAESGRWSIDYNLFVNEMYPLVAGLVLISLSSYFIIASAVRRYKCYLASGQDYNKMISLAESIDDLTNPAQITKLSDYPKLQSLLRNYGGQIKEISSEFERKEKESRSVDFEIEIDSLFNGNEPNREIIEGKWWASLFMKVESYMKTLQCEIGEMSSRKEQIRHTLGQTVLSFGKIIEAVADSSEDLLEIVRSVGELDSIAKDFSDTDPVTSRAATGGGEAEAIVGDMETYLEQLAEGSSIFFKFSEENNGLALNMALMAARGEASENDLAQFAEKVRSTAERFDKLGKSIVNIGNNLGNKCGELKRSIGGPAPAGTAPVSDIGNEILAIARKIEDRSKMLQEKICYLGSELQDANELLQKSLKEHADSTAGHDGEIQEKPYSKDKGEIVNFGAGSDSVRDTDGSQDLVIDHGGTWDGNEGTGLDFTPFEMSEKQAVEPSFEGVESSVDERATLDGMEGVLEQQVSPEIPPGSPGDGQMGIRTGGPGSGESWMEMPGHRWVKIDVEKSEREGDVGAVEVEVREDVEAGIQAGTSGETLAAEEPVQQADTAAAARAGSEHGDDNEPVHDLFELGAVEYVEETQARS